MRDYLLLIALLCRFTYRLIVFAAAIVWLDDGQYELALLAGILFQLFDIETKLGTRP